MFNRALCIALCVVCASVVAGAGEDQLPFVAEVQLFRVQGDTAPLLISVLPPEQRPLIDEISSRLDAECSDLGLSGIVKDADALQVGLAAAASDPSKGVDDINHGAPLTAPLGLGKNEAASIEIRDDQPVYYFAPAKEQPGSAAPGRLFELRKWKGPLGLKLMLELSRFDLRDPQAPKAQLRTRILPAMVVARNSLGDTSLEVGEPAMSDVWDNIMLHPTLGKWTAIVLMESSKPDAPRKSLFLLIKVNAALPDLDLAMMSEPPPPDEPAYSAEFKIIHVKHDLGEAALRDWPALSDANRISGDAAAYSISYDVDDVETWLLLADGTTRPLLKGEPTPGDAIRLPTELLSAPRVTTVSPPQDLAKAQEDMSEEHVKYKVLMRDSPVPGRVTGAPKDRRADGSSKFPSPFDPPRNQLFLFRDLGSFIKRDVSSKDEDRLPFAPAIISDSKEETIPYLKQERGSIFRLCSDLRDSFGFACGIALTELENGQALEADVLFRHNALVQQALIEGTNLAAGPPVLEQNGFRYVIRTKPDEWIGFAYPRKDGHMLVFFRAQKATSSSEPFAAR